MSPRPWGVPGPGDEQAPCEMEPACCPSCGGSGVDDERVIDDGRGGSCSDAPCDACEVTGYATPADYWAACAAELGDL